MSQERKILYFQKEVATHVSEWCHIGVWSMS